MSPRGAGSSRQVLTDERGLATIRDLPPGSYAITAHPSKAEIAALAGTGGNSSASRVLMRRAEVELSAGETVHVTLAPNEASPVHLTGKVVAGDAPFGTGNVWSRAKDGTGHATTRTDSEGRYDLYLAAPGEYVVSFRQWESGMNYETSLTVPDVETFEFDVQFPVGSLSGRVLGPDGRPLAFLPVQARSSTKKNTWQASSGIATTDEDGLYEIDPLPAGTYDVHAGGGRHGTRDPTTTSYVESKVEGVVVSAGASVRGIDLRLSAAGRITGIVRTASGQPVEAIVSTYDSRGAPLGRSAFREKDSDQFEIAGLEPGMVSVRASNGESTSGFVQVDVRAGETVEVELVLEHSGSLAVVVPNAGEDTSVAVADQAGRTHTTARSKSEPRWNFRPLPPGTYTVTTVDGERRATATVEVDSERATEIELALE